MTYGPMGRVLRYPVWIGVLLLSSGFAIHYLSVRTMQSLGLEQAGLFKPGPVTLNLRLDPSEAGLLGAQLFGGALRTVYGALSSLGLLLTITGLCLVCIGLVFTRRQLLTGARKRLTGVLLAPRRFALLICLFAFVAGMILSPLFMMIVINLAIFIPVSVVIFFLTLLSVVGFEQRAGPVTTVLVVWPLTVGVVFLPVIAGAFASPATAPFIKWVTDELVRLLLLTVLSVGDLDHVLVRVFELRGNGFLAFWVVVDISVGIALGSASHRYQLISVGSFIQRLRDAVPDLIKSEFSR